MDFLQFFAVETNAFIQSAGFVDLRLHSGRVLRSEHPHLFAEGEQGLSEE